MVKTKKKLLLINPDDKALSYSDYRPIEHIIQKPAGYVNAALVTIAALTPKDQFEIEIIDDRLEPINFDKDYDLVGITAYLTHIVRARELALKFRKRNIPVILGGAGVSINPDRFSEFADIMIIGEAERIWPQFLNDFINGSHKSEYRDDEKFDLDITPIADYSFIPKKTMKKYLGAVLQTSRGCPFNCEFCDAIIYVGRKTRYKKTEVILGELQQLYSLGIRNVFLGDDNFSANRKRSMEILTAISKWNQKNKSPMSLSTALTIDIAKDEDFLILAAEAGLTRVFIGVESVNEASLKEANKKVNIKSNIIEDIKNIQEHGILVLGGGMVGFDNDDLSIFKRQFKYFTKLGIPNIFIIPLHAPDGTPLKERLIKEDRYIDFQATGHPNQKGMNIFNTFTVVPKQMTVEQLQQGTFWLIWELYKPENFEKRMKLFFDTYENSPIKKQLNIKGGYDKYGLILFFRIVKYILFRAPRWEKRLFWNLMKLTNASTHPQRLGFALSGFLFVINTKAMLLKEKPDIADISYPV